MKKFVVLATLIGVILGRDFQVAIAREVVYAAIDQGRVEKFELDGTPIGGFNVPIPYSIGVDSSGYTYVSSAFRESVYQYGPDGHFRAAIYPTFVEGDQTELLNGSAVGPDGDYYVAVNAGTANLRIERFATDGTSQGLIPIPTPPIPTSAIMSIAFDPAGKLYAYMESDRGGSSFIRKFDTNGTSLGVFASFSGRMGDMAFDSTGNLFIVGPSRNTISEFDPAGQLMRTFSLGDDGFFKHTIAFDSQDILYVGGYENISFNNKRAIIRTYLSDGTPLSSFTQVAPPGPYSTVNDLVIVNVIPEPPSVLLAVMLACCASLTRSRRPK